ncbi:MAG: DUF5672 family protein [Smithella sp.]
MLSNKEIGIVIPVYKAIPSKEEETAISRAFQILNNYRFYFVAPNSLNLIKYKKFLEYSPEIIRFSDSYFNNGLDGYNQLMLSENFYTNFLSCKYILIYQPDSYIFRDELMDWCKEGYDYVGAPWLEDNSEPFKLNGVGNGGFSLRNIDKFLYILSKCEIQPMNEQSKIKHRFHKIQNKTLIMRLRLLNLIGNKKVVYYRDKDFHEDGFWGLIAPEITKMFRTAPAEMAIKFSFDKYPDLLYQMNDYKLPFGCHAWDKWNPEFWKKHFSEL